ncbi:MAG: HAMP domain-containing histidine kinase [Clostridiales bacterium]|nr:HAMP domain-containing histidine kinase [Clostridiales bacterium]MDY3763177.1 HAMP domain-containing sensor histidine kinase [Candidatus Ventricola sp.]MCI6589195.1 HAMP domain-containing histidine kinase [Clostridiales bacterium]MCI7705234.1 HAMP domain-containing histidine kinase [Clostridiales bacterium]MDY4543126.1 HAMP domain-containing sensor histidine kinase [Candidatus Ventricola sp.]
MNIKGLRNLQIQLPEIQLKPGESRPLFEEDPRIRRKPFSWRMFVLILLVLGLLSAANVFIVEIFLKMEVFSVLASMGVGTYWVAMAVVAAIIIHQVSCAKYDKPMRRLSRAMRAVAQGDFTVSVQPVHKRNKFDYMDLMFEDFNSMVHELSSIETMKDDFIANVSHEIKTPLAVIRGYASALQRGNLSEEEQREYAATIASASESLSVLISNILRLNKLENQEIVPNAAPYDLTRQLSDCALAHEEQWERKHIDFDAQLEERVMILADESMLEIVFNNLIANAIKFTEPGGRIVLRQEKAGGDVVVTVSDTGCGMDEETVKHIFDKFYQGDSSHSREGNGLGLALVKRVLDISGGSIAVRSAPGEGSEFIVRLKRIAE